MDAADPDAGCQGSLRVWLDEAPRGGPVNMALDESLLAAADAPVLRVYRWDGPWISFGCFGRHAAARSEFPGRPLVRRWTGGGLVDHACDWTYSLVLPAGDPLAALGTAASYRLIHKALAAALAACGMAARLADAPLPGRGGHCFRMPVQADVVDAAGRKIAGAAQRRTRDGLLHQGSVQGIDVPGALAVAFAAALHPRPAALDPAHAETAHRIAARLVREKYGSAAWLERR